MYIKLPLYGTLYFYMALGLNDFDGAYPLRGPSEGEGPENRKSFGPTTSNGSRNGFARIKIIMSLAIKTTGTLIVKTAALTHLGME
jgi:hypothetical protein